MYKEIYISITYLGYIKNILFFQIFNNNRNNESIGNKEIFQSKI